MTRKQLVGSVLVLAVAIVNALPFVSPIQAQAPPRLSTDAAERLIRDGDRLAEQADYLHAVEKYTDAYLGIVSQIRGQDFFRNVKPSLLTRTELGEEMKRQFVTEYTAEELKLMDGSLKALGLVPTNMDVKATMTKLLTEEVGGFYDPRTKAMVLIREDNREREPGFFGRLFGAKPTFNKEEQKITLSHELTHALQDQHYGLQAMQESIEKDDDMLMAFSALVEGDATLVMFGEMGRQEGDIRQMTEMDPQMAEFMFSAMKLFLPVAGGKTYRNAPPIFRDGLIFPYFQGMVFNLYLSRKGGFDRIHRAYQSPPVSTEQILHPDKYLSERDDPVAISIPGAESALPKPWRHLGGNCLGEFQTGILLKQVNGGSDAALGWDGDRYEVYEDDTGKLSLLWSTTWDTPNDAQEFEAAFLQYCRLQIRKNSQPIPTPLRDLKDVTEPTPSLTPEQVARVRDEWKAVAKRNGKDVLVVKGLDENLTDQSFKILESAMKTVKRFPVAPKSVQE